jgi:hypothetical protein
MEFMPGMTLGCVVQDRITLPQVLAAVHQRAIEGRGLDDLGQGSIRPSERQGVAGQAAFAAAHNLAGGRQQDLGERSLVAG